MAVCDAFSAMLQDRPYRFVIRARDAAGNTTRPKRPRFRIVR